MTEHRNEKGQLHRADGPAIIWPDGTEEWWFEGKRHRADGPANIWANGTEERWFQGQLHRADGPAIVKADGKKEWWIKGSLKDEYYPNFGCALPQIKNREQALERLNSKPRPYSYDLYMADIDRIFPA